MRKAREKKKAEKKGLPSRKRLTKQDGATKDGYKIGTVSIEKEEKMGRRARKKRRGTGPVENPFKKKEHK